MLLNNRSSNNNFGAVIKVVCDEGYELTEGQSLLLCNKSGQWTGPTQATCSSKSFIFAFSVCVVRVSLFSQTLDLGRATCDVRHATTTESVHTPATLKEQQIGMGYVMTYKFNSN